MQYCNRESTVRVLSAHFFYNKYKAMTLWYLCDIWDQKTKFYKHAGISEAEKVTYWQAIMALRRIFLERGYWDNFNHGPMDPADLALKAGGSVSFRRSSEWYD